MFFGESMAAILLALAARPLPLIANARSINLFFMNAHALPISRANKCRILMLAGCLLPTLAMAHPGHYHPGEKDEFDTLLAGFAHPFSGWDHLLIALAVGGFAMALGRRLGAAAAASFLAALAAGAILGHGMGAGAGLEVALAATLLMAGAGLIAGRLPSAALLLMALALGGGIHGFAHGAEAPTTISIGMLVGGWVGGTAVLIGMGAALQRAASRHAWLPRLAGALLVSTGTVALLHLI